MDWVEGITLDKYIRTHIDDKYELSLLAYQFSRLAMWLIPQPFAHGDLKPDNILVQGDGTLVLVDYDGMYVPAMKGQKARELGIPKDNIFILENGDALEFDQKKANQVKEDAPAGEILVDGLGVGDVGSIVLRDRKILSESGLIIVVASVDKATKRVVSGPDLISRGFVYVKENEDLLGRAQSVAVKSLERCENSGVRDWNNMKNAVRDDLRRFITEQTGRRPVILPIFMEV